MWPKRRRQHQQRQAEERSTGLPDSVRVRPPSEDEPIVVEDTAISIVALRHWEEIWRRTNRSQGGDEREAQQAVAVMFIDHLWQRGEAERLGIEVTEAEIDALVTEHIRRDYAEDGSLAAFLEETGQTMDDLRLRVRIARYSEVIRDHVTRDATSVDDMRERLHSFRERYDAHWSARTRCLHPYVDDYRCRGGS